MTKYVCICSGRLHVCMDMCASVCVYLGVCVCIYAPPTFSLPLFVFIHARNLHPLSVYPYLSTCSTVCGLSWHLSSLLLPPSPFSRLSPTTGCWPPCRANSAANFAIGMRMHSPWPYPQQCCTHVFDAVLVHHPQLLLLSNPFFPPPSPPNTHIQETNGRDAHRILSRVRISCTSTSYTCNLYSKSAPAPSNAHLPKIQHTLSQTQPPLAPYMCTAQSQVEGELRTRNDLHLKKAKGKRAFNSTTVME